MFDVSKQNCIFIFYGENGNILSINRFGIKYKHVYLLEFLTILPRD